MTGGTAVQGGNKVAGGGMVGASHT